MVSYSFASTLATNTDKEEDEKRNLFIHIVKFHFSMDYLSLPLFIYIVLLSVFYVVKLFYYENLAYCISP